MPKRPGKPRPRLARTVGQLVASLLRHPPKTPLLMPHKVSTDGRRVWVNMPE
jgi:hypothetical protein